MTTINQIAKQMKINPKVARAKLRRFNMKRKGTRWELTAAQVTKVRSILRAA